VRELQLVDIGRQSTGHVSMRLLVQIGVNDTEVREEEPYSPSIDECFYDPSYDLESP